LPESTQEWTASLSIAELPVNSAAANLAMVMTMFAPSAASTTTVDSFWVMRRKRRARRLVR
jgi:hypothetical protein